MAQFELSTDWCMQAFKMKIKEKSYTSAKKVKHITLLSLSYSTCQNELKVKATEVDPHKAFSIQQSLIDEVGI